MKPNRLLSMFLGLALLCVVFGGAALAETEALDYTAPFVGIWECDFSDYPSYVEAGYSGVVTVEFMADGTASTYYNGELDDSYGYFAYMNFYVAILETGETKTSPYTISEDGTSLEFTDMDGNWLITYEKIN